MTKPTNGLEVCLYGRVSNAAGQGVPNATVQVWQPDETGNYDLQKHDPSEMDLRGTFRLTPTAGSISAPSLRSAT